MKLYVQQIKSNQTFRARSEMKTIIIDRKICMTVSNKCETRSHFPQFPILSFGFFLFCSVTISIFTCSGCCFSSWLSDVIRFSFNVQIYCGKLIFSLHPEPIWFVCCRRQRYRYMLECNPILCFFFSFCSYC